MTGALPQFVPKSPKSPERDALAKRLGIKVPQSEKSAYEFMDDIFVWAQIGMKLADNEPEFSGRTGKRGRPTLANKRRNTDYTRALHIRRLRAQRKSNTPAKKVTQTQLVESAIESGHSLFAHGDVYSLTKSVSRGNTIIRKAEAELQKLQAANFRAAVEGFRRRAEWLKSVEPYAKRLERLNASSDGQYFGLLFSEGQEKMELQAKLIRK